MSVINKMLRDLDRRSAMGGADAGVPVQQVMVVRPARGDREWFWRIVAALMIIAIGWVAWVAYQLQPRSVVTEVALAAAADRAREKPAGAKPPVAAAPPAQPAQAPAPKEEVTAKPAPTSPVVETLKLALSIETPILDAARPDTPQMGEPRPAPKRKPSGEPLAKASLRAASPDAPRVERREPVRPPAQRADSEFRRAVSLLNQGRISEAEDGLAAALAADARHESARQAMVALLIEQKRLDDARRVLQEGIALNPGRLQFSVVLARIYAERGEYAAALQTLNAAKGAGEQDAGFHALLGTVLQRLGRHAEAAEAYQQALRVEPRSGTTWIGLAISLEALGRAVEAGNAYRQALAAGPLTNEVREYAEGRARALK